MTIATTPMITELKNALFSDSASGIDLTRLGRNYGVKRPKHNSLSDDLYRQVLQEIAWKPKTIPVRLHNMMEIIFGSKATSGWDVFNIRPNQVIVELPRSLVTGDLRSATYFQQDLTPFETTLTGDHAIGVTVLTVATTVGMAASGMVVVDKGFYREWLKYTSIGATTINLDAAYATKKFHGGTILITQFIPEPSSSSYVGDYFGVFRRTGLLDTPISATDTTANLQAGHNLPSVGWLVFEEGTATREKIYCSVAGNVITIHSTSSIPQFVNGHGAGSEVRYYSYKESFNVDSKELTNDNPVTFTGDTRLRDFLEYLDLIVAAGIEVIVMRKG